jgi:hypothetical protein
MNNPIIVKDLLRYRFQINEFRKYNGIIYNLFLYRFFFKWRKLKTENDSLKYKIPWITFPAISHIQKFISKNMKVFEYGSGGSTIYFAERVEEVNSIEHDKEWFTKLSIVLERNKIRNVRLKISEPLKEEAAENIYYSDNENYKGLSFKNYVLEINKFPDRYFDIILIDGRARNACFLHSFSKLKKGGLLIWDNTERERYREYFQNSSLALKVIEVPGPTPFSRYFTLTTIFVKK